MPLGLEPLCGKHAAGSLSDYTNGWCFLDPVYLRSWSGPRISVITIIRTSP